LVILSQAYCIVYTLFIVFLHFMQNIKNIIFDFGEVIINIAPEAVSERLAQKGIHHFEELHRHLLEKNIYHDLETDAIGPEDFRNAIRNFLQVPVADKEIDEAWNAMILDIPAQRIAFMEKLKSKYKLFLLSNTNSIHYKYYNKYFTDTFNYPSLDAFFEKAWYSYLMGVRKPNSEIFRMVLENGGLNPEETMFIDDLEENVIAAASVGIHPCHLPPGKEIMDLFDDELKLIQ